MSIDLARVVVLAEFGVWLWFAQKEFPSQQKKVNCLRVDRENFYFACEDVCVRACRGELNYWLCLSMNYLNEGGVFNTSFDVLSVNMYI